MGEIFILAQEFSISEGDSCCFVFFVRDRCQENISLITGREFLNATMTIKNFSE